jgi:hypothetical protein
MKITLDYFLGLLNSDGTFLCIFKKDATMTLKYRIQPQIQISQKNKAILKGIQDFLKENGIKTLYKRKASKTSSDRKNQTRADAVEISGIDQVRKAIRLIETSKNGLIGLKFYDFLLTKQIISIIDADLHNKKEGRCQIIDIRVSLHEPPPLDDVLIEHYEELGLPTREEKPIPHSNRKSREDWEAAHGFQSGDSISTAKELVSSAQKEYKEQCYKVKRDDLSFSPDQISGIIDGNGSLYSLQSTRRKAFNLVFSTGNESLWEAFLKYFGDQKPCFYASPGSVSYQAHRKELLLAFTKHIESSTVMLKNWKDDS